MMRFLKDARVSSIEYTRGMFTVQRLPEFDEWLDTIADRRLYAVITARVLRLERGLFGDAKFSVEENVHELRIHLGTGWRVYFTQRAGLIVVLLAGGSKRTQQQDLKTAENLAKTLKQSGSNHDYRIH